MSTQQNRVGPVGDQVRSNITRLVEERYASRADLIRRVIALGRHMDQLALRRIERGERRVDADDLVALATALGVTPAQLLEPPTDCRVCQGTPPPGFACTECGTTTTKEQPSV